MALRPCAWCDQDYEPRTQRQHCCSTSCAQQLRQAQRRAVPDYQPPPTTGWRTHPSSSQGLGTEHARLRRQLLPAAIHTPCPLCGNTMHPHQRLALDHITPRAHGGTTTRNNVRITHYECNHRAGGRLGGVTTKARRQHNK